MGQVELNIRIMRPADIQVGMRLKELAGWNQTERDWEGLMTVQPDGCFVGEIEGQAVTTATAMNYSGRVGWIGMILVVAPDRAEALTALLREAGETVYPLGHVTTGGSFYYGTTFPAASRRTHASNTSSTIFWITSTFW